MKYCELEDGLILCIKILEITAFPTIESDGRIQNNADITLSERFEQLLSEIHALSKLNTSFDITWATEEVSKQTFNSKLRIFFIIRKIDDSKYELSEETESISKHIVNVMTALGFSVDENVEESIYKSLLDKVGSECVYAIVKKEYVNGNDFSMEPYYYTDVISGCKNNNFNGMITALSQSKGCCVSFQLFPTRFFSDEIYNINEYSVRLKNIAMGMQTFDGFYRDLSAEEPLQMYSYYAEHSSAPIFTYNIICYGNRQDCDRVAATVLTLLRSGDKSGRKNEHVCLDISETGIDPVEEYSYYPGNLNLMLIENSQYKNAELYGQFPVINMINAIYRLPFLVTVEEASAFFRLPFYQRDMAALSENRTDIINESFDKDVVSDKSIVFGTLWDNSGSEVSIGCPPKALTQHAVIVGMSGTGKTTFFLNLLLQLNKMGVPFLAIEPTKKEYRTLIDAVPDLQIFTPGNSKVSPFILNPFIPPKGITLEQYKPAVKSAFKAALGLWSPLDVAFENALEDCYVKYGWHDYSKAGDDDAVVFGLHEFLIVFKQYIKGLNYSKDVKGNIESGGVLRISNLLKDNRVVFDSVNTIPLEDLLSKPTVIELNSVTSIEDKSLIIALLLAEISTYTMNRHTENSELQNVMMIDEAHVIFGQRGTLTPDGGSSLGDMNVKRLRDMIAEMRSYGTGIIIADQSPVQIGSEVMGLADIKVSFKLVDRAQKEMVSDSIGLEKEKISNLGMGQAYVYYRKLNSPQMIKCDDIRKKTGLKVSLSDEYIEKRVTYWNTHGELLKPYRECVFSNQCKASCDNVIRSEAAFISKRVFSEHREKLLMKEITVRIAGGEEKKYSPYDYFRSVVCNLGTKRYKELFEKIDSENRKKLIICSRISLIRLVTEETDITIPERRVKEWVLYEI